MACCLMLVSSSAMTAKYRHQWHVERVAKDFLFVRVYIKHYCAWRRFTDMETAEGHHSDAVSTDDYKVM